MEILGKDCTCSYGWASSFTSLVWLDAIKGSIWLTRSGVYNQAPLCVNWSRLPRDGIHWIRNMVREGLDVHTSNSTLHSEGGQCVSHAADQVSQTGYQ